MQGSPLWTWVRDDLLRPRSVLAGVLSRTGGEGCEATKGRDIYTKVLHHVKWIEVKIYEA